MNDATMNTGVNIYFQALHLLCLVMYPEVELLESFNILRNSHTDFGFSQTVFEMVESLAVRTGI